MLNDKELVKSICLNKNNSASFEVLHDRYSKQIYNICLYYSNAFHSANDLYQEVFLKLFVNLDTFKENSKFSTWLYFFTNSICINAINNSIKNKSEKKMTDYDNKLSVVNSDSDLENAELETLQRVIKTASKDTLNLLVLKCKNKLSIKEISLTLDINESDVKLILNQVRLHLDNTLPLAV